MPTHIPKLCQRACNATPKEKLILKISNASKKIKNTTHSRQSMTRQLNNDNDLQTHETNTTGYNSTYKKLAVQWLNEHLCFVSSLVVADSLVL
jgi:hypothetical protein